MLRLVPVQEPDEPSIKVSEHACMSLVNLSNDSEVAAKMLSMKVIGRVMDYIREGACPHHRLMVGRRRKRRKRGERGCLAELHEEGCPSLGGSDQGNLIELKGMPMGY